VLLEARETLAGPLLWVDVDGSLLRKPNLATSADFMAYPKPNWQDRQWHVGTLYFGDTEAARELLRLWVDHLRAGESDELALDRLWKAGRWAGAWSPLPPPYFVVENNGVPPDTVVLHRLSSSPYKRAFQSGLKAGT
jgi:hypothetical protein